MFEKDDLVRYRRQIIFGEIGESGQQTLQNSKVLVVGAGGLGSPVLYYLTAVGIGTIGVVDADVVELSNLNRQILHFEADIGMGKTKSAVSKLKAFNSKTIFREHTVKLNHKNVDTIMEPYDLIVDCVDNLETRYLVNQASYLQKKPLVEAGIMGFEGFVMSIIPDKGPCYECFNPKIPSKKPAHAAPPPVVGATAGIAGSMQAVEAVKILLGVGKPLTSRLLIFDALNAEFSLVALAKSERCPVCGSKKQ
jgi:adenylyltransferase/sulfurtransferase